MYHEVLKDILDTEERLQKAKMDAQANAKNMIGEAEKKGQASVSEAVRRADLEATKLLSEADRKAERKTLELQEATLKKQTEIRCRAESRLNEAAGIIIERIVNG